jgi:hypothetical protein
MSISSTLIPILTERFPGRGLRVGTRPDPIAVFPSALVDIGELSIYDDGDEATISIQNITHNHVNPYDESLTSEQREKWITENVVDFLTMLFNDEVLLWSVNKGFGGGGCQYPFEGVIPDGIRPDASVFTWAKKIR